MRESLYKTERKTNSIARLCRTHNWYYCKLPPVLAIAYTLSLLTHHPFTATVQLCFILFVSITSCGAYGHIVNDIFDIPQDRLAGKKNFMENVPVSLRWLLAILSILVGFSPFFFFDLAKGAAIVLFADYVLATIYSAPPFRLKEKPYFSFLTDAIAVHLLPIWMAFALFSSFGSTPFFIAASFWAFFAGLRGIIVHQLWDEENDGRAGVVTFVRKVGPTNSQVLIRRFLFPAELISFLVVTYLIGVQHPIFLLVVSLYAANSLVKRYLWQRPHDPAPSRPTTFFIANDFYESWFPICITIFLAFVAPQFILLFAAHFFLFYRDTQKRLIEELRLARDLAKAATAQRTS
jgi:hypothetical protein